MPETVRALIIQPGDEHATLADVDSNDLQAMQKLVGGWLEGLPMPAVHAQALINEEGKVQGLPVNKLATRLAWAAAALRPDDTINGPMVIVSVGKMGSTTAVPEKLLVTIRRAGIEIREEG